MASMDLKATNFLSQKDSNYINFFLYGEEPSLTFRCLKHVLLNEDMKMIEKIYLNLDDENFESNFTQSIMTNSLFNEKKIIFINLEKNRLNKDILKELSDVKSDKQILVGFALETDDEVNNAKLKLKNKNLDAIVMNSLNDDGSGFDSDTNQVTFITELISKKINLNSKSVVAHEILTEIANL